MSTGLLFDHALRHEVRTAVTLFGNVVTIVALGLLRTITGAWRAKSCARPSRVC